MISGSKIGDHKRDSRLKGGDRGELARVSKRLVNMNKIDASKQFAKEW